jgi:hypothetical protein
MTAMIADDRLRTNCVNISLSNFDLLTDRANLTAMMMECPRCGFVQPQDRFCANCGLNVATFRAQPKPLVQRLLSSPVFYISLAILLVFGVVLYLKRTELSQTDRGAVFTENTAPVSGGGVANPNARPAAPPAGPAVGNTTKGVAQFKQAPAQPAAPAESLAASVPEGKATPGGGEGAAGADKGAAAPAPAPTAKPPSQIEIAIYEVDRDSWQSLGSDMKSVTTKDGWRLVRITNRDKLSGVLGGAQHLPGGKMMGAQPSAAADIQFPVGSPDAGQGLFMDFSVVKLEQANVDLDLGLQVALKIDDTSSINVNFESPATLPPDGALAIVAGLPRKGIPQTLAQQLGGSPLSVLASPEYMGSGSELVIVLQGK